jgi:hypothetical protein
MDHPTDRAPTRTRVRPRHVLALIALALLAAAPAIAQGDPGAGAIGGAAVPGAPSVTGATCAGQQPWTCARGQVLTISGESLQGVTAIVFLGDPGARDDVRVRIGARASQSGDLMTVVPRAARSGRVRVISALGSPALSPRPLSVVAQLPATDDAGARLIAGGRRAATVSYTTTADPGPDARLEALRVGDGAVVRSWPLSAGGGEIRWDGFAHDQPVATGTYVLRLNDAAAALATITPGSDTQFDLLEGFFPIRGPHQLASTPAQRFGGPRGHQGSDNFAGCGTPLAAWTKGVVQIVGFQAAAGNYVVVARPDGEAYVYMHLRDRALVSVGEKVFAGERLGYVGQTGDAQGCHLHIETWTAPGYYKGGHPIDSLPLMRRLDAFS